FLAHAEGRRALGLGHQCGPAGRGGRGPLPQGPAVSPQHAGSAPAAAARAGGGHPATGAQLPRTQRAALRPRRAAAGTLGGTRAHGVALARNVRELQHLMERAALLAEHDEVGAATLAFGEAAAMPAATDLDGMTLEQ